MKRGPRIRAIAGREVLAPVVVGRLGILETGPEDGFDITTDHQRCALNGRRGAGPGEERFGRQRGARVVELEVEGDGLAAVLLDQVLDLRDVIGRALGDRVVEVVQVVESVAAIQDRHEDHHHDGREGHQEEDPNAELFCLDSGHDDTSTPRNRPRLERNV